MTIRVQIELLDDNREACQDLFNLAMDEADAVTARVAEGVLPAPHSQSIFIEGRAKAVGNITVKM